MASVASWRRISQTVVGSPLVMLWRNFLRAVLTCACCVAANGVDVHFKVVAADTGRPLPCRVHMKDPAGKAVRPGGRPFWHDHFVCAGIAELDLSPGNYRYQLDRRPEHFV